MPAYTCKLISTDGSVFETVVDAESRFEIYEIAEARDEGVLSVKIFKKSRSFESYFESRKKIKPQELEDFTSQLVVMLKAGVPLITSLKSIVEQLATPRMSNMMNDVIERVEKGESFSNALSEYPKVFDSLYVNMVKVGEATGVLDTILFHLKQFIHHDIAVRRKIKSAMRYPKIVLGVLAVAFIGAMGLIIPQFADMFSSAGVTLPLPTRILIGISNLVTSYWYWTFGVMALLIMLFRYYIGRPTGRFRIDSLKLAMPVFKHITLESSMARFAHILSTLNKSGIKIIRTLEITEQTIENRVIAKDIGIARSGVIEGMPLAEALSPSKHFPKTMLMMMSVGEESGALDDMLDNISEQYDSSVDVRIEGLSTAIEPMLTIVLGAFLLIFALAIFLPMWRMSEVI